MNDKHSRKCFLISTHCVPGTVRLTLCVLAQLILFLEEVLVPLCYRWRQKQSNLPRVNIQLARGTARMRSQVSQLSQPKLSVSSIVLLEETWNLKGDYNWHNNSLLVMKGTWLMTEEPVAPSITFLVIEAGHSVSCQPASFRCFAPPLLMKLITHRIYHYLALSWVNIASKYV